MGRLISPHGLPCKTPGKPQSLPPIIRFSVPKIRFLRLSRSNSSFISATSSQEDLPSNPRSFRTSSVPRLKLSSFPPSLFSNRLLLTDSFDEYGSGEGEGDWLLQRALTAGTSVLLSPLIGIIICTILGDPAYADVQTTATIEGRLIGSELLTSAWTGFFAGWLHTLSAPDHLAALAPLSIGRTWMESAAVGALWGCGHNTGQVIFGLLFLLLKDHLHFEVIQTWGTGAVGLTLLVIGGIGIREVLEVAPSYVVSENERCEVGNFSSPETASGVKMKTGFMTFATGIVHGLQPDALMVVFSTLALPSRLSGASFLGMFLLGTISAMGSYTVFIGSCNHALKGRIPKVTEKLTWASSLAALVLGVAILISQLLGFNLY